MQNGQCCAHNSYIKGWPSFGLHGLVPLPTEEISVDPQILSEFQTAAGGCFNQEPRVVQPDNSAAKIQLNDLVECVDATLAEKASTAILKGSAAVASYSAAPDSKSPPVELSNFGFSAPEGLFAVEQRSLPHKKMRVMGEDVEVHVSVWFVTKLSIL